MAVLEIIGIATLVARGISAAATVGRDMRDLRNVKREMLDKVKKEAEKQLRDDSLVDAKPYNVTWLQESLKALGYQITVDGDYGLMTRGQVALYQYDHGLETDGWAGIMTVSSIIAELKRREDAKPTEEKDG